MAPQDARAFLEVHHAAVRETAAKDHPPEVIEAWAPLPIDEAFVEKVRRNLNGDFRVVAEIGGEVIGMAVLVPLKSQVLACYVSPAHSRKGVGSALMYAIEQEAEDRGLEHLRLNASLTAVAFYKTLGFHERGETEHVFASGVRTTSIKMKKALGAAGSANHTKAHRILDE
jgi:putative acetyltransferase